MIFPNAILQQQSYHTHAKEELIYGDVTGRIKSSVKYSKSRI